jgi:hypothetical protein
MRNRSFPISSPSREHAASAFPPIPMRAATDPGGLRTLRPARVGCSAAPRVAARAALPKGQRRARRRGNLASKPGRYTGPSRGCGGIGRRARFRSVWGKPRGGSSPLIRIATSSRFAACSPPDATIDGTFSPPHRPAEDHQPEEPHIRPPALRFVGRLLLGRATMYGLLGGHTRPETRELEPPQTGRPAGPCDHRNR